MPALEKILIFAHVLKVVGPNRGLQTHSTKHYHGASHLSGVYLTKSCYIYEKRRTKLSSGVDNTNATNY